MLAIQVPTPYVHRGLRTRVPMKSTPPKSGYFSTIGLSSVKTHADRHKNAAYHNNHWWHDF